MNSLVTRFISAVIALALLGSIFYFLKIMGLKIAILFAVLVGAWELDKVLFRDNSTTKHRFVFYWCSVLIFILSSLRPQHAGLIFSFFFVCFSVFSISAARKNPNLNQLADLEAKAAMGFFYVGLLPSFAYQLIDIPNGIYWFTSLLAVVFAGDVGAYTVGILFGQRKIMPNISPKKTFEGAIGGLVFSLIAGLSCSYLFPEISKLHFCLLSVATGVIAQFGDYFESLLKRVANVKDSGQLMPGHGGVLDRIDGVLFGCPVFLLGAIVLEKLI
jgi:phosphatidate cytidylyltransferase